MRYSVKDIQAAAERLQKAADEAGAPAEMDPCGECPKGTCDRCSWCIYVEGMQWGGVYFSVTLDEAE